MSVEWHPDENALYEIDEECIKAKLGKCSEKESMAFNYLTLLLCFHYV